MTDRITPHFTRKEFQCKGLDCDGKGNNCGGNTVDVNLAKVLNLLRLHFCRPVIINGGFRCKKHNKSVGGGKNSQHLKGKAADIVVKGVKPKKVCSYLRKMYPDKYGIGQYNKFTHIDVREIKARWFG